MLDIELYRRGGVTKLHPRVIKVLYNCTIDSVYMSMRDNVDLNVKAKAADARRLEKMCPRMRAGPLLFDVVKAIAMKDHMTKLMTPHAFYSCPLALLPVRSLGLTLEEPATKRIRTEVAGRWRLAVQMLTCLSVLKNAFTSSCCCQTPEPRR